MVFLCDLERLLLILSFRKGNPIPIISFLHVEEKLSSLLQNRNIFILFYSLNDISDEKNI